MLRFLTGSPPDLTERAAGLLEEAQRGEVSLRVHPVIVAETVWVLQSFYGYSKREISSVLIPLFEQPALRVEAARNVIGALETMAEEVVDFADALLAVTAQSRAEGVTSFDKDFRKLDVAWREPG